MEQVQWKVDGMDCNTCALNIHKYLEKKGMKNIKVNFATGYVSFDINGAANEKDLAQGINGLGYEVAEHAPVAEKKKVPFLSTHLQRFCVGQTGCLPDELWQHYFDSRTVPPANFLVWCLDVGVCHESPSSQSQGGLLHAAGGVSILWRDRIFHRDRYLHSR